MMKFLKRLFHRTRLEKRSSAPSLSGPDPDPDLDDLDVHEVLALIDELLKRLPAFRLMQHYKRLFDIAWFDHHVTADDRELARTMAAALKEDILAGLNHDPAAAAAFVEASDNHSDRIPFHGVGSLQWIVDELNLSAEELIPFVVQKQWADIFPTFLTIIDDHTMKSVRGEILRQLIKARRESLEQSDVRVLHALSTSDRAAEILLKPDELRVIRGIDRDFETAERLTAVIVNS